MPIYAYKCSACGFAKDVLQKLSDAPLTRCPNCGAESFGKQLTAAGFQLKGSGWYVTDFRDGGGKKPADKKEGGDAAGADAGTKSGDGAPGNASEPSADKKGDKADSAGKADKADKAERSGTTTGESSKAPAAAPSPAPAPSGNKD